MSIVIKIEKLSKTFTTCIHFLGFWEQLKAFVFPQSRELLAIKDLSLEIKKNERVAFIGPNENGKSTTIKMLTGILHVLLEILRFSVLVPWKDRHALGYQICKHTCKDFCQSMRKKENK
ncbi:MAG: ATP-binding cassette domain-containing protein [Chlamydiae bacterium]|nr:ATP-binding cassette domain-containing protein [Chlamydiota bacterium]